jgi:shikimate dehydrogenase
MRKRCLIGLIGANIQHSLSPALHEDAFAQAGIAGHYHLVDMERLAPPVDLGRLLDGARALGFAGVNVTHPCKEAIVPLLDEVAPDAAAIGAVNTVVIDPAGRTRGHNTDRAGFLTAFEEGLGRASIAGRAVLLIGAGGAGRAVAHALCDLGAAHIAIYDQDFRRAQALAAAVTSARGCPASAATSATAALQAVVGAVNATPVGMNGHPGLPLPADALRPDLWIADIVYTPLRTPLIAAARRAGCRVMTGVGMCVHQAAAAFRLFTGIAPDVARMHGLFATLRAERDTPAAAAG